MLRPVDVLPLLRIGKVANSNEDFADAIFNYLCNKSKFKDEFENAQLEYQKWFEASMKEVLN